MIISDTLSKLYVEITTICNLDCRMCVRRAWSESTGHMKIETFQMLVQQVKDLSPVPIFHFGGYGEPLHHPQLLELVRMVKAIGGKVEMTTNGTLLTPALASELVDLGLDRLVVSIDGVTNESYENIRVYSDFQKVIDNLKELRRIKIRKRGKHGIPQVGIAFVAMKSNINDLAALPWLATRIGASEIIVSNMVPHTAQMEQEILYKDSLTACTYRQSPQVADMSLPKFDINEAILPVVHGVMNSTASISLLDASLSSRNDYCRFVQDGYAAVRWDGELAPCLPLLHDHPEYIRGRRKDVTHHSMGNIHHRTLSELWQSDGYTHFRTRLREFPFSPCSTCGGCQRFAGNQIDCTENTFPTCGGCLWAQGFIQCP